MTIEDVKKEIMRRVGEYRRGAATYPDLDNVADCLEDLLQWIKTKEANAGKTDPR